jgi:hypothetical protein
MFLLNAHQPFHAFEGCVALCLFCTQNNPYLWYMALFNFTVYFCAAYLRPRNGIIANFQVFKVREKQHSSNQYEEHCSNICKTRFVFVMNVF